MGSSTEVAEEVGPMNEEITIVSFTALLPVVVVPEVARSYITQCVSILSVAVKMVCASLWGSRTRLRKTLVQWSGKPL